MTLATSRPAPSNGSDLNSKSDFEPTTENSLTDCEVGELDIDLSITVRDMRELLLETLRSSPEIIKLCLRSTKGRLFLVGYNALKVGTMAGTTWLVTRDLETTTGMVYFTLLTSKSAWLLTGSLVYDSATYLRGGFDTK